MTTMVHLWRVHMISKGFNESSWACLNAHCEVPGADLDEAVGAANDLADTFFYASKKEIISITRVRCLGRKNVPSTASVNHRQPYPQGSAK